MRELEKSRVEWPGTEHAARNILGIVGELLKYQSVVDVGCNLGRVLSVVQEMGIEDFLGIDGPWINDKDLAIPREKFRYSDLECLENLDRIFDLVISLEVAEHVSETNARNLVKFLTSLGPVVIFSAAIPGQGGYGHINEQWPGYWVKLFSEFNFSVIDCIRKKIWDDDVIQYYYRQNTFLYVRNDVLESNSSLTRLRKETTDGFLNLVHPECYLGKINIPNRQLMLEIGLINVMKLLPPLLFERLTRALKDFKPGRKNQPEVRYKT